MGEALGESAESRHLLILRDYGAFPQISIACTKSMAEDATSHFGQSLPPCMLRGKLPTDVSTVWYLETFGSTPGLRHFMHETNVRLCLVRVFESLLSLDQFRRCS